jgi:DNA-binding NarL/FixJ family response regulator
MPASLRDTGITNNHRLTECLSKRPIRVALVENQPQVRENWIKEINFFQGFACSCACVDGEEALESISLDQPDAVLMEIILPGMSGIECTYRLKNQFPHVQVVMFTSLDDENSVLCSLGAGADGYLLKQTTPSELRAALLEVLDGGAPMSSQIIRCVVHSFRWRTKNLDDPSRLSLMEEWVLMLLCAGHTNRVIAHKLGLSINTVCCHLKQVFRKLRVGSRTEAVICYLAAKNQQQKAYRWQGGGLQKIYHTSGHGLKKLGNLESRNGDLA